LLGRRIAAAARTWQRSRRQDGTQAAGPDVRERAERAERMAEEALRAATANGQQIAGYNQMFSAIGRQGEPEMSAPRRFTVIRGEGGRDKQDRDAG
jgi:hypothetical protein